MSKTTNLFLAVSAVALLLIGEQAVQGNEVLTPVLFNLSATGVSSTSNPAITTNLPASTTGTPGFTFLPYGNCDKKGFHCIGGQKDDCIKNSNCDAFVAFEVKGSPKDSNFYMTVSGTTKSVADGQTIGVELSTTNKDLNKKGYADGSVLWLITVLISSFAQSTTVLPVCIDSTGSLQFPLGMAPTIVKLAVKNDSYSAEFNVNSEFNCTGKMVDLITTSYYLSIGYLPNGLRQAPTWIKTSSKSVLLSSSSIVNANVQIVLLSALAMLAAKLF